jgi:hypothetical protein
MARTQSQQRVTWNGDEYGSEVVVMEQEPSGKSGLYITSMYGPCDYATASLDREGVEWLRDTLTRWLETGELS